MISPKETELPRKFMARIISFWLIVILFHFYLTNSLVHQWEQPVLIFPGADNTYWLLHIFNIPQTIMQSKYLSLIFDIVMIGSTVVFFLFPNKTFFCLVSVICFWLFHIMYGSANGHHYHHFAYLIVPMAFIFRNSIKFYFAWELIRYWILFLMLCAGLYKLYYGAFFQENYMSNLLKLAYDTSSDTKRKIFLFLIIRPKATQLLYQAASLFEIFSVIGFFTHKFDRIILLCLLVFNLGNAFFMNISFWENGLMLAPFFPWSKLFLLIGRKWSSNNFHHWIE